MSDHIASLEVRHDAPSVIHNVSQEELLYMRAKGLSWKDIEEADNARTRRKKAAFHVFFFVLSCLLCFLFFKAYQRYQEIIGVETTISSSEFFVPTDKPGVLNSTHEWLDARPFEHSEPPNSNNSSSEFSHDPSSRSGSGRNYDSDLDSDWNSGSEPEEQVLRKHRHPTDVHGSTTAPLLSTRSRSLDPSATMPNASSFDFTDTSIAA